MPLPADEPEPSYGSRAPVHTPEDGFRFCQPIVTQRQPTDQRSTVGLGSRERVQQFAGSSLPTAAVPTESAR